MLKKLFVFIQTPQKMREWVSYIEFCRHIGLTIKDIPPDVITYCDKIGVEVK